MALLHPEYLDSVVAIGIRSPQGHNQWIGTGFLVQWDVTPNVTDINQKEYRCYLVSNRHVLQGLGHVLIRFSSISGNPQGNLEVKAPILSHSNKDYDVAVMVIPASIQSLDAKIKMFPFDGQNSMTITEMKSQQITEGDSVYVLGFPFGDVGGEHKYVVVRSGIIARIQHLLNGHSSDYMIDATVFPGNSGGPVLLKPEVATLPGAPNHPRPSLIGIVKSYRYYPSRIVNRNGEQSNDQTEDSEKFFQENTGLTMVEPIDCIIDVIKEYERTIVPQILQNLPNQS